LLSLRDHDGASRASDLHLVIGSHRLARTGNKPLVMRHVVSSRHLVTQNWRLRQLVLANW
jgi:hypothetical protein